MKLIPIPLFLVLAFFSVSCHLNQEHSSASDSVGREVDSVAYARLMAELAIAIAGSGKKMELGFGMATSFIGGARTDDAKETKEEPFDRNKYVDARR